MKYIKTVDLALLKYCSYFALYEWLGWFKDNLYTLEVTLRQSNPCVYKYIFITFFIIS